MLLYCWLLAETTSVSKNRKKIWKNNSLNQRLKRLECARIVLWLDQCVLETAFNQTVSEQSDLWPDKFQTNVQTKVRSKTFPDHVIRAHREHVCVPRWLVWSEGILVLVTSPCSPCARRPTCARMYFWSDSCVQVSPLKIAKNYKGGGECGEFL